MPWPPSTCDASMLPQVSPVYDGFRGSLGSPSGMKLGSAQLWPGTSGAWDHWDPGCQSYQRASLLLHPMLLAS